MIISDKLLKVRWRILVGVVVVTLLMPNVAPTLAGDKLVTIPITEQGFDLTTIVVNVGTSIRLVNTTELIQTVRVTYTYEFYIPSVYNGSQISDELTKHLPVFSDETFRAFLPYVQNSGQTSDASSDPLLLIELLPHGYHDFAVTNVGNIELLVAGMPIERVVIKVVNAGDTPTNTPTPTPTPTLTPTNTPTPTLTPTNTPTPTLTPTNTPTLTLTPTNTPTPTLTPTNTPTPTLTPTNTPTSAWALITQSAAFYPRDGAGALVFDGKMWLLGGWNPYHTPTTNSEVWYSTDGQQWTLAAIAPWEQRHYAGYVVHDNKMWIVGGDSNSGHYQNDVWNSADGINWQLITASVPWADRATHYVLAYDSKIWVMGGQQIEPLGTEVYNDVWSSPDGVNWTLVTEHAPWSPRGQIGGSVVFDNKMWLIGGGTYNSREYYNDVWYSTDGINWSQTTANAPWNPREYHDVAVFDEKMWVLGGYNGRNLNDVWYSSDGVNWQEQFNVAWPPRHASSVFVYNSALWLVAGNLHNDVWRLNSLAPTLTNKPTITSTPTSAATNTPTTTLASP